MIYIKSSDIERKIFTLPHDYVISNVRSNIDKEIENCKRSFHIMMKWTFSLNKKDWHVYPSHTSEAFLIQAKLESYQFVG